MEGRNGFKDIQFMGSGFRFKVWVRIGVWFQGFGLGIKVWGWGKVQKQLRFGNISLRFMVYGCFIAFRLLLHEPLVLEGSQMLAQVSP